MTQKFVLFCLFYNILNCFGQTVPDEGSTVSLPPTFPRGPKPDTAGTAFRYSFTANAQKTYPDLAFHYLGQDTFKDDLEVIVSYDSLVTGKSVNLQASGNKGIIKLASNDIVWHYLNQGFWRQPNTIIFVNATLPIRLYAFNQDPDTKQMDITTVLPIVMAGKNYIVTLPTSYPSKIYDTVQFQVLYFIPATIDSYYDNIITVQMINADRKEVINTRVYNGTTYLYYFAWSRYLSTNQPTFYVTSTKPILIVAALTCTPIITDSNNGFCDYAAYMPPTSYVQDCAHNGYDLHAADTTNTVNFYVAPPVWNNCQTPTDDIYSQYIYSQQRGDRINYVNAIGYQPVLTPIAIASASVAFRSDSALIQVTRVGGVDVIGHNAGAFLTHMPGIGSFVSGIQYFPIFSTDAHLEVVTTNTTVYVDGSLCEHQFILSNPNGQWFYFLCEITGGQDVAHFVYSPNPFAATVIGHDDSGLPIAYGYEIAYNKPLPGPQYTISTTSVPTTTTTTTTTNTPSPPPTTILTTTLASSTTLQTSSILTSTLSTTTITTTTPLPPPTTILTTTLASSTTPQTSSTLTSTLSTTTTFPTSTTTVSESTSVSTSVSPSTISTVTVGTSSTTVVTSTSNSPSTSQSTITSTPSTSTATTSSATFTSIDMTILKALVVIVLLMLW